MFVGKDAWALNWAVDANTGCSMCRATSLREGPSDRVPSE